MSVCVCMQCLYRSCSRRLISIVGVCIVLFIVLAQLREILHISYELFLEAILSIC